MATAKRRVSYILPSPVDDVPRLQLPPLGVSRLGATGPLLIQYRDQSAHREHSVPRPSHPRHRLGVASLALDTSTQLVGRHAPEGILYSGGRDGLLMSWDLAMPMRRRMGPEGVHAARRRGSWELMTGWEDDIDEELDDADDRLVSDGDVLGDVTSGLDRRRRESSASDQLPYERQWETDMAAFQPGTKTQFRQCTQAHTDWVNDILLCNYNQTVVSASSDGTVKAWSPHAAAPADPTTIGTHSDYVRCLTHCREQNWVASGSFDRTIKLWDLHRTSTEPLMTLNPPDALAPKSSVYAIAADPFGRLIASGSPERVVRLWDPRTGKRTGKLVGHTDNIRAILVSEDSKYLLTGSADASIKLWSLTSQRCLHTFTHHADSVWSLFSDHPSLEVFYSGDRAGLVCRVDVEDCPDISDGECLLLCSEAGVDQARPAAEGINKIVVMDDNLLWTASGTSTIHRWNIPLRRGARLAPFSAGQTAVDADGERSTSPANSPSAKRRLLPEPPSEPATRPTTATDHLRRLSIAPSLQSLSSDAPPWRERERDADGRRDGVPYDCMVRLVSPNDPFAPYGGGGGGPARGRDPEVATLYSAASVMSVPHHSARSPPGTSASGAFPPSAGAGALAQSRTEEHSTARALFDARELAADALPAAGAPDGIVPGAAGLVRSVVLNDRVYALAVDTAGAVAVWDIVRGVCLGRYAAEDVARASRAGSSSGGEKEHSPREALEAVRERIEGEAVVANWCYADTKAGVLTIHLTERCFDAEVYADEVGFAGDRNFNDESKLNLGKWVLRNLFIGFIKEELRLHQDARSPSRTSSRDTLDQHTRGAPTSHSHSPSHSHSHPHSPSHPHSHPHSPSHSHSHPHSPSHSPDAPHRPLRRAPGSTTVQCAPNMVPAVPPNVAPTARSSPLLAPLILLHPHTRDGLPVFSPAAEAGQPGAPDAPPAPAATGHQRTRSGTLDSALTPTATTPAAGRDDYFSARTRQAVLHGAPPPGSPDDFSGWTGPNKPPEVQTPSTPGGLMGRLKSFGKIAAKRPVSESGAAAGAGALAAPSAEPAIPEGAPLGAAPQTPAQRLLAGPFEPPTHADAPPYRLPHHTAVLIAAEAQPSYTTVYRGTVAQTQHDVDALEEAMPLWLLEYLLMNRVPPAVPLAKMSFVLVPWNRDPGAEALPELLNTAQSKLTASRSLRVRKIVNHVQDKLDRIAPAAPYMHLHAHAPAPAPPNSSRAGSVRSFSDAQEHAPPHANRPRAEDEYEILCNETVLPLEMSLAAIRQYVWKQGTELVLHYRRKQPAAAPT